MRAAEPQTEPGDHFVEDQDRIGVVAQRAQCLKEPRGRRDNAHVRSDRLDDEAGDLVSELIEDLRDGRDVVVGGHDGIGCRRFRDAGRFGKAERGNA